MIIHHVDSFCNALLRAADESDAYDGWSAPQDMAAWSKLYYPLPILKHSLTTYSSRPSKLPNPRRDLLPNLWPRFQPAHIAVIALARKRHCIRKPPNLHAIRVPRPLQRITVRMVQP